MSGARDLVVVSWYDQRPIEPLHALLASIDAHDPGRPFEMALVINRDGAGTLALPERPGLRVLERANRGMNIGAWDHAWRQWPDHDAYLFLQDECLVVADGWLRMFADRVGTGTNLVGESLNLAWDRPWPELRATIGETTLRDHRIGGRPANRVDVYLDFMRRNGIDPGAGGLHLRSLVWYARRETLECIGGFPEGGDFGECIGAEIGVSRAVVAAGGRILQLQDEPFAAIRHAEWRQWEPGGAYHHGDPPAGWRPRVRTKGWRARLERILRRLGVRR